MGFLNRSLAEPVVSICSLPLRYPKPFPPPSVDYSSTEALRFFSELIDMPKSERPPRSRPNPSQNALKRHMSSGAADAAPHARERITLERADLVVVLVEIAEGANESEEAVARNLGERRKGVWRRFRLQLLIES
jgi:hypothetical protein